MEEGKRYILFSLTCRDMPAVHLANKTEQDFQKKDRSLNEIFFLKLASKYVGFEIAGSVSKGYA